LITATLIGDREVVAKLNAAPDKLRQGLARAVTRLALETERLAKQKVSGPVLKVRTGSLRSSINIGSTPYVTPTAIYGQVGTNIRYARIHEFGGQIHVPEIRPKKARVLAFEVGGQTVFAMRAAAHVVKMPERSFLRSALREMQPRIEEELRATVARALV
jgi:phage gpG-like protein